MKVTETINREKVCAKLETNDFIRIITLDSGQLYYHICYDADNQRYVLVNLETGVTEGFYENTSDIVNYLNNLNTVKITVFDKDDIELKLGKEIDYGSYYLI